MLLSVIIPAYNRLENIKITLASLSAQKGNVDFEVIVADDGSTDGIRDWIRANYSNDHETIVARGFPVLYISGGPNKGFRGARIRNLGAFNSNGDRFVFLDDLVIHENVLENYVKAAEAQPDAVIVGRYIYLPKIDFQDKTYLLWTSSSYDELMLKVNTFGLKVEQPHDALQVGSDLGRRDEAVYLDDPSVTRQNCGLSALSGNISYPKKLFYDLGGFDEHIEGHGGEDADLGLSADERSAKWVFYKPLIGFHIWHPRNQEKNAAEVEVNIQYIDKKHHVGKHAKNYVKPVDGDDLSDVRFYTKDAGAVTMKSKYYPTVYAVREDLYRRIGITSPDWLQRLGFLPIDIKVVDDVRLDMYKMCGITKL